MTQGEPKKRRKLPNLYTFMQTGSNSEGDGPRWQTNPGNPMLSPNGQVWDACERLQQFVYSPSEAPANIRLHDNTKDDLPTALQVDANITRPKWWPYQIQPILHHVSQQPAKPLQKCLGYHTALQQAKLAMNKRSKATIPVQSWTTTSAIHLNTWMLIC